MYFTTGRNFESFIRIIYEALGVRRGLDLTSWNEETLKASRSSRGFMAMKTPSRFIIILNASPFSPIVIIIVKREQNRWRNFARDSVSISPGEKV